MGSRWKVLSYEVMHAEGTKLLEEKCDVIYAKSFEESHLISLADDKAVRADLEEVCRRADFISVNLPLLPGTRGYINAGLIRHMKSSAILVNMARGPIWNEADVLEALKTGRIAAAGADVFEEEPTPAQNPLFTVDNFVGTPHMAAHTNEGMIRMSLVAQDVLAVLEGRTPEFLVPGTC